MNPNNINKTIVTRFITALANEQWPETTLPSWTKSTLAIIQAPLPLNGRAVTWHAKLDEEIQKIQNLINLYPPDFTNPLYYNSVQSVQQKIQKLNAALNQSTNNNHHFQNSSLPAIGTPSEMDIETEDNYSCVSEKYFASVKECNFTITTTAGSKNETTAKFHVNLTLLATKSPFFLSLVEHWSTSKEGIAGEIQFDVENEALDVLLDHLHTGNSITLSNENIEGVMTLALMWHLEEVSQLCNLWIQKHFGIDYAMLMQLLYKENSEYCKDGRLNLEALRPLLLKNLSTDNYQQRFQLAEDFQDHPLQEKILTYFALCVILAQKTKNMKLKHLFLPKDKEKEIMDFLRIKGPLLTKLDLAQNIPPHDFDTPGCLDIIVDLFPNLESLNLGSAWPLLNHLEMAKFVSLKKLKELHFAGCANFAGLTILGALKQLEKLTLSRQKFCLDDPGIAEFFQIGLWLNNRPLTSTKEELQAFAQNSFAYQFYQMPNLKELDLSNSIGVNLVLQSLKHTPLEKLVLKGSDYRDSDAQYIADISTLKKLDLSDCKKATGAFLELITSLQNLEELDIRNSLKDGNIAYGKILKKLPKLEKLWLESVSGGIQSASQLWGIEAIQTLKELWLGGSALISFTKKFLGRLQNIQKLYLKNSFDAIQDDHILSISTLSNLQHLEIEMKENLIKKYQNDFLNISSLRKSTIVLSKI